MNDTPQVKLVEIDGIKIQVELPPYFIAPDIEKGMNYYPTYLKKALVEGKPVRTPASYLNDILRQVGNTGERREEILKHYSQYVGSAKVLEQMESAYKEFVIAKNTKYFVRITDKKNRSEIYPQAQMFFIINEKMMKGESLMLEPILFKSDQDYDEEKER